MPTVESKVYAATLGSGAGAILSGFLLWVLGVTFWHSGSSATNAVAAAAAVPAPVAALVALVLTIGGTFASGFAAPHTSRPDLARVLPLPSTDGLAVLTTAAAASAEPVAVLTTPAAPAAPSVPTA